MSSCFINQDDNVCVQKYVNKLHNSLHFLCLLICLIGKAHTRLYFPNRQSNKISKTGKNMYYISLSLCVCVWDEIFSIFFVAAVEFMVSFLLTVFLLGFFCVCVRFYGISYKESKSKKWYKNQKKKTMHRDTRKSVGNGTQSTDTYTQFCIHSQKCD